MSAAGKKVGDVVDSSRRMLELLSLLQLRREWPGAELAERLGVSDRTLRRDIDKLRELDYPVHAGRGAGGGYRLGDGGRLPPLQFLSDEAVAAAIALTTAASSNVHGVGEAARRALGELEQVLPSRLRARVQRLGQSVVHLPGAAVVDPDVLMTVAGACRDQVLLRFDYVRGDGTESRREVEPYGLVAWTGRWYLVAWDLDRRDWRTFRVDRLRPRIPLGRRFTPRELPGENAGTYLLRRVRDLWQEKAVVLVDRPADSDLMRRWATHGQVQPVDDHRSRLLLDGDSIHTLAGILAELDADFVVEAPEELRRHLREVAARLGRAGQRSGALTASTGHGASSSTVCAADPRRSLPTGERCRSPMTSIVASSSPASATSSSPASCAEVWCRSSWSTPAPRSTSSSSAMSLSWA